MSSFSPKYPLLLRLTGQLYCCKNMNELKTMVLDGLRALIPYESAAFFLVNPQSMQYIDPLFRDLDRSWFKKYTDYYEGVDIYKKTVFAEEIPFVDRSSDYMDYRQWQKNEHRADFLLPQGIYHLSCLQIMEGGNMVGEISLHRNKRQEDFSKEEMEILLLLHEHISSSFSRIKLICQRDFLLDLIKNVHLMENLGFILMDKNFKVVNHNKAAAPLVRLNGHGQGIFSILKEEFRSYLAKKTDLQLPGPLKTSHAPSRHGDIKYRSVVFTDSSGDPFLLAILDDAPGYGQSLCNLKEFNITNREREIAQLILVGKTNSEICSQLFISENTLKTHVKQLYSKLNIKNRNQLIVKLVPGLIS